MAFTPKEQIGVGAVSISEREKKYVNEALDNNRLSYGPFSRRLEKEFAKAHDCKYAVLTNSGTSSLQIAFAALKEKHGWQDGDEILCPATTFIATSNTILQNNLAPVFVDVEKETYNINPEEIEKHITPKTRCIVVVHLYGQPAEMEPILAIAKKHDLRIVEDSCETMFARYKGTSVGAFGDISCFSTYACHILVTGVGGITCTNDQELAVMLRSLANHGRDNIYISIDDDKGKQGEELKEVLNKRFSFVRMGYSYRLTELESALGVGQLEAAPESMKRRREVAAALLKGLSKWEKYLQLPKKAPNRDHSYMMFPLLIRETVKEDDEKDDGEAPAPFTREEITLFLEEHKVETRTMVSLLDQPYYKRLFGEEIEDRYPVAKWINHNGFYIGSHPEMSDEMVQYILDTFEKFFKRYENTARSKK